MTRSVGVHAAKTHLSRLLEQVSQGEEIEITRRGVVVARLVAPADRQRVLGIDRGRFEIPSDFDAPLTDDELARFEG